MKNIWEIIKDDFKSTYSNAFVCIIIVFLMFIPSIYAWFNIVASWDPYANTGGILVGVANNDKGAVHDGKEVDIGGEIIEGLKKNKDLGWRFTTENDALKKVKAGDYYAAIIIPDNFSEHIMTVLTDDPSRAQIDYYVNEKINSIAPKMTAAGANSVVDNVSKSFTKTASKSVFAIFNDLGITLKQELPAIRKMKNLVYGLESKLPEVEGSIETVQHHVQRAEKIILPFLNGLGTAENLFESSRDLVGSLDSYADSAKNLLEQQGPLYRQELALLKGNNDSIAALASQIDTQGNGETLQALQRGLEKEIDLLSRLLELFGRINGFSEENRLAPEIEVLDRLQHNAYQQLELIEEGDYGRSADIGGYNSKILGDLQASYSDNTVQKFTAIASDLHAAVSQLQLALETDQKDIPEIRLKLEKMSQTLMKSSEDLKVLQAKYPEVRSRITALADKMRELERNYNIEELIDFLQNDMEKESDFFSEPVLLKEHSLFPIPNYGSGMSPFFTVLSLWVGGTILISMISVEVDQKVYSPYQIYIGRYFLFMCIGIVQAVIVSVGDIFFLKAFVADKLAFVSFSIFISIVFTLMVYTFVSVFGNVGKGISVVLMVLQISSSGGTFPIQVTPPFFQHINPWLPFTYAVQLLREAVGGMTWHAAARDLIILLIFFAGSLLLGLVLKKPLHVRTQKMKDKLYGSRLF